MPNPVEVWQAGSPPAAVSMTNPLYVQSTDALGTDVSGTITTNTGTVISSAADGFSTVTLSISGTYGGFSAVFEQSDDAGTTWYPVSMIRIGVGLNESSIVTLTNQTLMWRGTIAGSDSFRIRATALTSGTVNVLMSFTASPTSYGAGVIANFVDNRGPAGTITTQDLASTSTGSLQDGAVLITGAPTANSTFGFAINGNSGMYTLVTGTWTGSLQFEKSLDGGTTWTPFGQHIDGTVSSESIITLNCSSRSSPAGATNVRLRAIASMTGTVNIQINFAAADTVTTVTNSLTVKPASATARLVITRPANATPYTANDVLGASAAALTFPSMAPLTFAGNANPQVLITGAQLEIDVAAVPAGMTSFRLYLYNVTPPSALADNAAWDLPSGDRASFLGYIDVGTPVDLGSTLYVETNGINKQLVIPAATTSLFGYLVTNGGFTPAGNSEVYVLTLHALAV